MFYYLWGMFLKYYLKGVFLLEAKKGLSIELAQGPRIKAQKSRLKGQERPLMRNKACLGGIVVKNPELRLKSNTRCLSFKGVHGYVNGGVDRVCRIGDGIRRDNQDGERLVVTASWGGNSGIGFYQF